MVPYYLLMRLPGEADLSYLVLQPFTAASRPNMVSFLVAKSDPEEYGQLISFELPADSFVDGPSQVGARINQDPDVSKEFTLLGQEGSEVVQGNMLVVPIDESILYVQPIYIQARQEGDTNGTAIPEFKRVVVVFGNRIVMRETLAEALTAVFGEGTTPTTTTTTTPGPAGARSSDQVRALLDQAQAAFVAADTALRTGDLAGYAAKMAEAEALVEQAVGLLGADALHCDNDGAVGAAAPAGSGWAFLPFRGGGGERADGGGRGTPWALPMARPPAVAHDRLRQVPPDETRNPSAAPAAQGTGGPFPADSWRALLDDRMTHWCFLDDAERRRLEDLIKVFVVDKEFEGAGGLRVAEDVKVTIAAQACLLLLGLDHDYYRDVHSIIVYPSTVMRRGPQASAVLAGAVTEEPAALAGEARLHGPMVIVWDQALAQARFPGRGHNVVYHEFAHKIDMADGSVDGRPPQRAGRGLPAPGRGARPGVRRASGGGRGGEAHPLGHLRGDECGGVLRCGHRGLLRPAGVAAAAAPRPVRGAGRVLPPGPGGPGAKVRAGGVGGGGAPPRAAGGVSLWARTGARGEPGGGGY